MLNLQSTRIVVTETFDVVPGIAIQEPGIALVYTKVAGATKVQPSTGAAGEVFAGFSFARNVPTAFLPNVEEFVIDNSLTQDLARTPLMGQCLIKVNGVIKSIVLSAPANAGQVMLSGKSLVFATGENGKTCTVQYMYEPTVSEASLFTGQAIIGGTAFRTMDTVGGITRGDISTNYYDSSVDWSNVFSVKLGVDGIVTTSGSGTVIPNAIVMVAPGVSDPFLTLRLV